MAELTESKGEFAKRIGLSAGRISQMILSGMIPTEALTGDGRMARIRVELAMRHIAQKRDIGQALGNGLGTRLSGELFTSAPAGADDRAMAIEPSTPSALRSPSVEDEIKQERLTRERRANRQAEEADALRRGELMETSQAKAEMTKLAAQMLVTFEGALPDFASAIAAKFEIPQRDVLHELKREFIRMRTSAAKREGDRAATMPDRREILLAAK